MNDSFGMGVGTHMRKLAWYLLAAALGFGCSKKAPATSANTGNDPCDSDSIADCVALTEAGLQQRGPDERLIAVLKDKCRSDPKPSWTQVDMYASARACMVVFYRLDPHAQAEFGKTIAPRLCERQIPPACVWAGQAHYKTDPLAAIRYLDMGCAQRDAKSCELLGLHYCLGEIIAKDAVKGVTLLTQACSLGSGASCGMAARRYQQGDGVPVDQAKALKLYSDGCASRDAVSCNGEAVAYFKGFGTPLDKQRGAAMFSKACKMGNADACGNLADAHVAGEGVAKDPSQAAPLYRDACLGKGARGACQMWLLNSAETPGLMSASEKPKVYAIVKESCDRGDEDACTNMTMVAMGDLEDALDAARVGVLERACAKDTAPQMKGFACYRLATHFASKGDGVRAITYMRLACDAGNEGACEAIAKLR